MKNSISYPISPKEILTMSCVFGLGLCLSGCASIGLGSGRPRQPKDNTRSELVFLNVSEASGWVAYNCNPTDNPEMEDYRIVVIRQKSGEIMYDSQIPLAADLCTHGFEMALDDPRLKRLSKKVDKEIIDPLEAYQNSLEDEEFSPSNPGPALAPEQPQARAPKKARAEEVTVEENETVDPAVKIMGMAADLVLLEATEETKLNKGDRLFLRAEPKVIAIPGSDETLTASEGQVSGLVQVVSVEDNTAKARILSGKVPTGGHAEIIKNP